MTLGQKLKKARLDRGLTQSQVVGNRITRNMLSLIENDLSAPSMKTLEYLAAALGVTAGWLLADDASDEAAERLSAAGYAPYYLYRQKYMSGGFENLGWAKPGTENLYNICMMEELCDVVALGAGGSSKFPAPDGSIRRRVNPKYPREYMERIDQNGL